MGVVLVTGAALLSFGGLVHAGGPLCGAVGLALDASRAEGLKGGPALGVAFSAPRSTARAEEDIKELAAILRGGDKGKRRAAVNKLVKLDTKEAWELVIEALDNEDAPAADEAQLDLAGLTQPKVFDSLWGRAGLGSKSRIVQLRTAELIGRREVGVEVERFGKALKERDDEVRRLLLWSVERLALEGRLLGDAKAELGKDLIKMMRRDGDAAVRGAALYAYGAIHGAEASAEWVVTVAEDKAPAARCAAARNVGWLGPLQWDVAAGLAADEASSVRAAAIWGLAQLAQTGNRAAAELLVTRVESETTLQLQWLLVGRLQGLSGMKHRLNPAAWRRWYDTLPEDWTPASNAEAAGSAADDDDRSAASFAGLPLHSDALTFLIDLSGSIWNVKNDKLPKDVAGEHLNAALDRLQETVLFNVIPYTNTPFPWEDEMVTASSKATKAAKQYFADCRERGAGNVYDAILLALQDERVDDLVILTDGAPSGGTRWNLNLLVPQLLEANRYRSVVFDSLLVGANNGLTRHWETLARETGGRCISIEL